MRKIVATVLTLSAVVLLTNGCSVSNVSVNTDFNMLGIQTSQGDRK